MGAVLSCCVNCHKEEATRGPSPVELPILPASPKQEPIKDLPDPPPDEEDTKLKRRTLTTPWEFKILPEYPPEEEEKNQTNRNKYEKRSSLMINTDEKLRILTATRRQQLATLTTTVSIPPSPHRRQLITHQSLPSFSATPYNAPIQSPSLTTTPLSNRSSTTTIDSVSTVSPAKAPVQPPFPRAPTQSLRSFGSRRLGDHVSSDSDEALRRAMRGSGGEDLVVVGRRYIGF